jgi:hypothetical protein
MDLVKKDRCAQIDKEIKKLVEEFWGLVRPTQSEIRDESDELYLSNPESVIARYNMAGMILDNYR